MGNTEVKRLPQNFGIRFGILAPSIGNQIKQQGLKYNTSKVKQFEHCRDAINTLNYDNLLVDTQTQKLFVKLYNKILRHVAKQNNCNIQPIKP